MFFIFTHVMSRDIHTVSLGYLWLPLCKFLTGAVKIFLTRAKS